jgi:ribosomal protein L30/L7E
MSKILIKKIKSTIGINYKTIRIMKSLGFKENSHVGKSIIQEENPPLIGKLNKVAHLVVVQKI